MNSDEAHRRVAALFKKEQQAQEEAMAEYEAEDRSAGHAGKDGAAAGTPAGSRRR